MSGVLLGTENEWRKARALQARAAKDRQRHVGRRARDEREAADLDNRRANQFLVDGRYVPGARPGTWRRVWAVYELCGLDEPKLRADGFDFGEEAVLYARDLCLGRVTVSGFGALGKVFGAGRGILGVNRQLDRPGEARVQVQNLPGERFIVAPGAPPQPATAAPARPALVVAK
jgi:hypothetical protein